MRKNLASEKKREIDAITIVSPLCISEMGHHYPYFSAFLTAMKEQGIEADTLISKSFPIKDLTERWGFFFHTSKNKWIRTLLHFGDYLCLFFQRRKSTKALLFESFRMIDLFPIFLGLFFFHQRGRKTLFFFRDTVHPHPLQQKMLKGFMKLILWKLHNDYVGVTDSILIANEIEKWLHKKIIVLPIPHTSGLTATLTSNPSEILMWLPGMPSDAKGLSQIRSLLSRADPNLSFLVSEKAKASFQDVETRAKLSFLEKPLSQEEYHQLMKRCDLLPLPYDPFIYRNRTSGIFVEAISSEKLVITQEGTWIAFELKRFNLNELILNWEDPEIYQKIQALFLNPSVREKRSLMRKEYQKYHSVSTFGKELKNLLCKN